MAHRYSLSNIEESALQDFKKRLKDNFSSNFRKIKLFGSRVRGDKHSTSDIDILVIFERRNKKVEEKLADILCKIVNEFGIFFEVISYSRKEYEESRRQEWPFILNVEREGIAI